jgi:iron complex outermembrane receptor protein
MRGRKPTTLDGARPTRRLCALALASLMALPALPGTALAQDDSVLEEIVVTAQRREENLQEVPISVSTLSGARFENLFDAGEDIRALATRVPSLYAESSNGRLAPRFYLRGLGNTDFDLAASQSVSIIMDEVVQENVILKSFPLFDVERVEVLRGPQGTLFGRNTPAGIIKFDTRKPTDEAEGRVDLSYGRYGSTVVDAAVGGPLADNLSVRASMLYMNRDDWISNAFTEQDDVMGGFEDLAYRLQALWQITDNLSALANVHGRTMDGTASVFRANILGPGSNDLNVNFDRNTVFFDEGNNNPQEADALGGSLKLEWDVSDTMTVTSITAHETVENRSLGDIDGGFGAVFLPFQGPCPPGSDPATDVCIPFPSQTQDGIDNLDQFTQEVRIAADASDRLFWQAGFFYFDSEFAVTTFPFFAPPTTVAHENTSWAVFGHVSYDISDVWNITGGVRYTDDEKDLFSAGVTPVNVSDEQVSWDVSLSYALSSDVNLYGRLASGFRAPTIQGRDIAFGAPPSSADSETITSIEGGFKSTLLGDRLRLNAAIYYYEIEDQQFSAIGGAGNLIQLVNADTGTGTGIDVDAEWLATDNLSFTAGFSWNDTEIDDSELRVAPCGSGLCTVLDPLDGNGNAIVDGNSFPQAPETMLNFTARYTVPVGDDAEFFAYTDWAYQGDTNFFLYESAEFSSEDTFEGGVKFGYGKIDGSWEVAIFGRNITDEENVKGGIDFNNLTGFVNEPRVWGVSFSANF